MRHMDDEHSMMNVQTFCKARFFCIFAGKDKSITTQL